MKCEQFKKIFITGVAGFIGSNLAAALLKKGYAVIGLDNLSQGSIRNIASLVSNKNFRFVKGDVRKPKDIEACVKDADCLVHLAAFKIPRYGNALDTLLINSEGTKNMLDAAAARSIKFIFASTSDVYGKSLSFPFCEEGDLLLGHSKVKRWAYAASKVFDEHLCFAYEEKYKLKVCVLRFFGSYGPNQNLTWWGGPQSVFINAALKDQSMEIHGDGSQTRSFTYIDDTVAGIIRAIEVRQSSGQIINIGNNNEITILNLAYLIWRLVRSDRKPKIKFIPYAKFSSNYQDVKKRVPSLLKAKKILGFKPATDLKTGLIKTIEWQKRMLACYDS